jgi:HAD superfamily phosphatase
MTVLLFDMDGVLVDVSLSYRLAIRETVHFFSNLECSLDTIQHYKNRGGLNNDWDLTERMLLDQGLTVDKQQIIDRFQQFYLGDHFSGLIQNEKWQADADMLEKLAHHYQLGIVTGRPRLEALYCLERFLVKSYFKTIITMDDVPLDKGKPDPFGICLALKNLGESGGYYLGDTADDMIAAKRAGLKAIGVFHGMGDFSVQKSLLISQGADKVIENVNQIKEIL